MVVRCTGVLLVIGIFLIVFPPEVFMGRYNTLLMDVTDKIARSILDSVTEKDISDADDESESYFKTTWDSLDGVINLEFPDVLPVGWNDVYRASSYLGQAVSDRMDWDSLKNLMPDLTDYGFDTEYIRTHINSWNWDRFADDLLKFRGESLDNHSHSYTQRIDDLADTIHSYTSFEASQEDEAELPPECFMTVPEIVRYSGYPCATYSITTKDGYKLTIHRIPFGRSPVKNSKKRQHTFEDRSRENKQGHQNTRRGRVKRPVVFLQHGILSDSSCWVSNGPNRSLAFLLADAGYDVWMGNVRGNTYSRAHVTLDPDKDERYWRFTWQDMSEYDLPAMVDATLRVTGQPYIYYIGHSQGTLIAFARLAEDKSFNRKIKLMFAFAPISTLANIKSPLKWLTTFTDVAHFGTTLFGGAEVLPNNALSKWITGKLHKMSKDSPLAYHGSNLLLFLVGFNVKNYHQDRLPVFLAQTPSGTSLHNFIHLSQMIDSGAMQKWNYWSERDNAKIYGQESAIEYDLSRIRSHVALFVGTHDDLAVMTDAVDLSDKLPSIVHVRVMEKWDHLDFLWGKEAPELLYRDVINFMDGVEISVKAHSYKKTKFRRKHEL